MSQGVAVLGVGAMGSALVRGWLSAEIIEPDRIAVYDVMPGRAAELAAELGVHAADDPLAAVAGADAVLLAVKPADVRGALEQIAAAQPAPLLVSIAAGVPLATLESCVPRWPVVRVMPNTAALVGAAASAYALGHAADESHARLAERLLSAVGRAWPVKESLLNAVTGLSGSGPAYVYLAIEALADGGVRCGLPRDVAQALAAQTLLGAARMVLETGQHPAALKDKVCSPGGTTIAGVAALEAHGFRAALIEAVTAATRRADELG
jgi:pyrroline-5-carboxylate reductase